MTNMEAGFPPPQPGSAHDKNETTFEHRANLEHVFRFFWHPDWLEWEPTEGDVVMVWDDNSTYAVAGRFLGVASRIKHIIAPDEWDNVAPFDLEKLKTPIKDWGE